MFNNNYLTQKNFTVNLKQIEQEIINIQKRIYNYSMKCRIDEIHNIQNHFLKNRSYYILFVKRIVKKIAQCYCIKGNYYWKILIYAYLNINITKKSSPFISYIKEKIYQDLIYILLKPEWNARYEQSIHIKQSKIYFNELKKQINQIFVHLAGSPKYIEKINLNIYVNTKYIRSQYYVNKIQSIQFISDKLTIWLNSNNCYQISGRLYKLLETTIYVGIEWQIYTNLRMRAIYSQIILIDQYEIAFINSFRLANLKNTMAIFLKNLDIDLNCIEYIKEKILNHTIVCKNLIISTRSNKTHIVKVNNRAIKVLLNNIRSSLYHKNYMNQWRLNSYLTPDNAKMRMQNILFNWYKNYDNLMDKTQVFNINVMLNRIFYTWQLKK